MYIYIYLLYILKRTRPPAADPCGIVPAGMVCCILYAVGSHVVFNICVEDWPCRPVLYAAIYTRQVDGVKSNHRQRVAWAKCNWKQGRQHKSHATLTYEDA